MLTKALPPKRVNLQAAPNTDLPLTNRVKTLLIIVSDENPTPHKQEHPVILQPNQDVGLNPEQLAKKAAPVNTKAQSVSAKAHSVTAKTTPISANPKPTTANPTTISANPTTISADPTTTITNPTTTTANPTSVTPSTAPGKHLPLDPVKPINHRPVQANRVTAFPDRRRQQHAAVHRRVVG